MHRFVLTLLPILTPASLLHNSKLNPGKGKGKENLKSKIFKKRGKSTTSESQKKFENEEGGKREEAHKYNETGESQKRLEKEERK